MKATTFFFATSLALAASHVNAHGDYQSPGYSSDLTLTQCNQLTARGTRSCRIQEANPLDTASSEIGMKPRIGHRGTRPQLERVQFTPSERLLAQTTRYHRRNGSGKRMLTLFSQL